MAAKWAAVAVSRDGVKIALRAKRVLAEQDVTVFTLSKYAVAGTEAIPGKLADFWGTLMADYDGLICVMASGIVVRGIAPHLTHKAEDPAVLVMDSGGRFVISLLSGHLGGANATAVMLAKRLSATAVITTGTDVKGLMAVDMLAQKLGCALVDFVGAKDVTAAILDDALVAIVDEAGLDFAGIVLPGNLFVAQPGEPLPAHQIRISEKATCAWDAGITGVQLIPKTIVCGVGCRRDAPGARIVEKLETLCAGNGIHPRAIAALATIGLKAEEAGIREAAAHCHAAVKIVPDKMIRLVQNRFDGSDFVEKTTGLRCVSEPAGYAASGFGECVAPVMKGDGVTLSLWRLRRPGRADLK
ncbi:cobalt-precorrin 5A hydrolase [Pseudoramibacter faecis]|uniref:cobalt-precorrin 5A hydrolase n=1 Tax=Pseudoramibacter faecis TaxID=3108534 RepID=UPI002E76584B|nr:cobalamin biosynthesis protein [Pseudoramibacter sp. HA2172]